MSIFKTGDQHFNIPSHSPYNIYLMGRRLHGWRPCWPPLRNHRVGTKRRPDRNKDKDLPRGKSVGDPNEVFTTNNSVPVDRSRSCPGTQMTQLGSDKIGGLVNNYEVVTFHNLSSWLCWVLATALPSLPLSFPEVFIIPWFFRYTF